MAVGLLVTLAMFCVIILAPSLAAAGEDWVTDPAALRFRSEFGYRTDHDYLAALEPTASSVQTLGVPLSAAEEEDFLERMHQQEAAIPLVEFIADNSESFGGVWLDQKSTGGRGFIVNIVQTPNTSAQLLSEAIALVPPGVVWTTSIGRYSQTDLEHALDLVATSRDPSFDLSGALIDTSGNRLQVFIESGDAQAATAIHPSTIVVNGVTLAPLSCSPAERCTYLPYRGGLQILDRSVLGDYQCSSGFWTKKNGIHYILTAAHCWRVSQNLVVYRDYGLRLGTWVNDSIPGPGMSCDGSFCNANVEAAYIDVDNGLVPSSGRNFIYASGTDKSHAITSYRTWSNIAQGQAICMSGVKSSQTCASITGKGMGELEINPRYGQGIRVHRGIFGGNDAMGGDTGGPVYGGLSSSVALGTATARVIGGAPSYSFHSSIHYSLSDMGLTLCTTSSC